MEASPQHLPGKRLAERGTFYHAGSAPDKAAKVRFHGHSANLN